MLSALALAQVLPNCARAICTEPICFDQAVINALGQDGSAADIYSTAKHATTSATSAWRRGTASGRSRNRIGMAGPDAANESSVKSSNAKANTLHVKFWLLLSQNKRRNTFWTMLFCCCCSPRRCAVPRSLCSLLSACFAVVTRVVLALLRAPLTTPSRCCFLFVADTSQISSLRCATFDTCQFFSLRCCRDSRRLGHLVVIPSFCRGRVLRFLSVCFHVRVSVVLPHLVRRYICCFPLMSRGKQKPIQKVLQSTLFTIGGKWRLQALGPRDPVGYKNTKSGHHTT